MDRWITDWERGEPDWMPYYTRANAGETLPDPASPLGWTFGWERGFVLGWIRGMEQMGIYREGEFPLERPAQLGMFGGYFYINLSHMRLMTLRLGGSAESADAAWVGSRADVPPYVPHPRDDDPEQSAKAAATVAGVFARSLVAGDRRGARAGVGAPRGPAGPGRDARYGAGQVRADVPAGAGAGLDLARLCVAVGQPRPGPAGRPGGGGRGGRAITGPHRRSWRPGVCLSSAGAVGPLPAGEGIPRAVCAVRRGRRGRCGMHCGNRRTDDVARFGAAFEESLAQYGCRGPNEWDLYTRSWEIDPAQPLGDGRQPAAFAGP